MALRSPCFHLGPYATGLLSSRLPARFCTGRPHHGSTPPVATSALPSRPEPSPDVVGRPLPTPKLPATNTATPTGHPATPFLPTAPHTNLRPRLPAPGFSPSTPEHLRGVTSLLRASPRVGPDPGSPAAELTLATPTPAPPATAAASAPHDHTPIDAAIGLRAVLWMARSVLHVPGLCSAHEVAPASTTRPSISTGVELAPLTPHVTPCECSLYV
ncbi:hypothetical protein V8E36_003877 [Tilletia maclaganii]